MERRKSRRQIVGWRPRALTQRSKYKRRKHMGLRDEMEKALTIIKKTEIAPANSGQPGSSLDIRRQPSIAGLTYKINREPSIAGLSATVRHFLPQEQAERLPQNTRGLPIITDHIELPRMCASRRMPAMARYKIEANQWLYVTTIAVDDLTQHMQYGGRVHDTFQFHSGSYGYEKCPWCSTVGFGALHCTLCDTFFCYGFVYEKWNERYTLCPSCGREDRLIQRPSTQMGIFPKVTAR
jgi:hypothetical protein